MIRSQRYFEKSIRDIEVVTFPVSVDNYTYLLRAGDHAIVIDPFHGRCVAGYIEEKGLNLACILNTHDHYDHTGGNEELKEGFGGKIMGPFGGSVPRDRQLREGDVVEVGSLCIRV